MLLSYTSHMAMEHGWRTCDDSYELLGLRWWGGGWNGLMSNNNYYHLLSYFKSDDDAKENLFEEIGDENEVTILNLKVVHAMKNLQALNNEDANKIVKQAAKRKKIWYSAAIAMIAEDTKPTKNELQTF